jgi:peptidoglycan/LPS O-acetylase OafA/YrhL
MTQAASPGGNHEPLSPERTQRMAGFDAIRFLTSFAIVWDHVPKPDDLAWTSTLGRFALHFFIVASVFFVSEALHRKPETKFADYLPKRTRRVYVPFLLWSGLYWLWGNVKTMAAGNPTFAPHWHAALNGTAYHLWFLSFVFVASLFSFFVIKAALRFPRTRDVWIVVFMAAAFLVLLLPAPTPTTPSEWHYVFRQGLRVTPTLFAALAFALTYRRIGPDFWRRSGLAWGAFAAVVILVTLGHSVFAPLTVLRRLCLSASGVLWLVFCLGPHDSALIRRLAPLGVLGYGIYLMHPALLDLWFYSLKFAQVPITLPWTLLMWVTTCAACAVLSWVLRRAPGGQLLVP